MQDSSKKLSRFIWHFVKQQWWMILLIQLFAFGWSIDHTMWPYVLMLLIDKITEFAGDRSQIWGHLVFPLGLAATLWISVEMTFRFTGILSAWVFPKVEASIRLYMFDYVQKHSYSYFSNNFAGTISNKISDMTQSVTKILETIITLFFPVCLALMISTVMFAQIQPFFAYILVSWVICHIGVCLFFARKCDTYASSHSESRSALNGKIVDSLTNHTNVKLFGRHSFEKKYLQKYQDEEQRKHWQSLWYVEKMKIVLGVVCFLMAGVGINTYMIYSWQQGNLTTGEVVFIFNTSFNITMMAWLAGLEIPNLFKDIGVCKQALSVIQTPHELKDLPSSKPLTIDKGNITFEDVTFRYEKDRNIFQGKTINLKAGEKVGLVGFSGSGKTTFVHLILRYFDIMEGRILIDGQNIAHISQQSLRQQIAMIPQDPCLFHRTLMENIRYGKLDATDEEVIEASKRAHCHEFVLKLPDGYQTMVGERGIKLSGGQRQRIAIARAILKNAPVVILDEATSALDSVTEKHIQESLKELMAGRTTLVIAHRLSTLADMDRILVFKDGKIVEQGTHDELLDLNCHYSTLWEMQKGGFLIDNLDLGKEKEDLEEAYTV